MQPLSLCILGGHLQDVRLYGAKLDFFINLQRGREFKPKKPSVGVVWILFDWNNTSITSLLNTLYIVFVSEKKCISQLNQSQ